jgi:hypothetical protein
VPEIDLLSCAFGSVTAPAGHGKTHLIAETLRSAKFPKPTLVLTHTNAGRRALEKRLTDAKVLPTAFRVSTIDSWTIRAATWFPARSGVRPEALRLENQSADYPSIRRAALHLLRSGDVSELVQASYSRVLVDEYQDCTQSQHQLVMELAQLVPTCVLGDPLQAIFGFKEPVVHWKDEVLPRFPSLGNMETPWRWDRAESPKLGRWLRDCRDRLEAGEPIDLRRVCDEHVVWVDTNGMQPLQASRSALAHASQADKSVLVLANSCAAAYRNKLASRSPGFSVVEALELKELSKFGQRFDIHGESAPNELVKFSSTLMTGLEPKKLGQRIATLVRNGGHKAALPHEAALVDFARERTYATGARALSEMRRAADVRLFRHQSYRALWGAFRIAAHESVPFDEAVSSARERARHSDQISVRKAIGSTLLLKGLEADMAIVLDARSLDVKNLYVALTRGARRLVVCSSEPELRPSL